MEDDAEEEKNSRESSDDRSEKQRTNHSRPNQQKTNGRMGQRSTVRKQKHNMHRTIPYGLTADRQTDRKTDRQTGGQTDKQTDIQSKRCMRPHDRATFLASENCLNTRFVDR